jgi:hypothetical protein
MRVTPTALLSSWEQELIKDMTSLGIDFETHVNWQGYIDEPTGKDFCSKEGLHYCIEQSARNPLERDQVQRVLGNLSRNCHRTSNNQLDSRV